MKVGFTISIEDEDAKTLDDLCAVLGISRAKLFESAVRGYVLAAKGSGVLKRKKASPAQLLRLLAVGSRVVD